MAHRARAHSHLSSEQIVLLAAARSELGADQARQIESAIRQGVNWEALWQLARAHGVGYFVGRHLQQVRELEHDNTKGRKPEKDLSNGSQSSCFSPFVVSCFSQFQDDLRREAARALALREFQLRLNGEFERCQTPVVWLKGLILAERLYGRFEARQCGDLDILVEGVHRPRAERILARLGFEPYNPSLPGQEYHPLASHHASWSLRLRDDWLLMVELHHRLSGPSACQPAVAELFERSRSVDFQGQAFRIPARKDELLILCLHAHHHNYSLLRCLMDVAEFVKRYHDQIDWPKLVQEARGCYCLGRLRAALEIADVVLGLEPARDVLDQVPVLNARQRGACRQLAVNDLLDPGRQDDDRRQAQLALLMDRWSDTIRQLVRRALPVEEHVRAICPAYLSAYPALPRLYYFWHAAKRTLSCLGQRKLSEPAALSGYIKGHSVNRGIDLSDEPISKNQEPN